MNNKSVLVTGVNGQLGSSIQKLALTVSEIDFTFVGRDELDLETPAAIKSFFEDKAFDVIVNCAAYTAVDKAESESQSAEAINHQAVKQLAQIAKAQNASLIHISTDYVFDGQNFKPYIEEDSTNPQSVYGQTKLSGEQAMQAINPLGLIIRTSWVYSEFGNNFVKTMLRLGRERNELGVIFDQVGTPTYAGDLAQVIIQIIQDSNFSQQYAADSIYHFSNEGVCSWYDFAKSIFEISGIDCKVNPIETKDYPTPAKRPHYSLMNKAKIKRAYNLTIPYWKDSLVHCLKELTSDKKD